jgi:hypothetical protein
VPILKCELPDGGQGYKWGVGGTCYSDREKALKQGRAIEISKAQAREEAKKKRGT